METLSIERLSAESWLRKFWRAYDVLYFVKKECTGILTEIYWGPDSFRNLVLAERIIVLLVSDSVGNIIWWMSYSAESEDKICIEFLWINQNHQAKGIGATLLKRFLEDTENARQRLVKLCCREDSVAFEFYKKHWFQAIWTKRSWTFVRMELFRPIPK